MLVIKQFGPVTYAMGTLQEILAGTGIAAKVRALPNDVAGCTLEMGADGLWTGASVGTLTQVQADALVASGALVTVKVGTKATVNDQQVTWGGAGVLVGVDGSPAPVKFQSTTPMAYRPEGRHYTLYSYGAQYSHVPAFCLRGSSSFIFDVCTYNTWVVVGGTDPAAFSAISFNRDVRPNILKVADLGASMRAADIPMDLSDIAPGVRIKLMWVSTSAISVSISKNRGASYTLRGTVDLAVAAPTIVNWKDKKSWGMCSDGDTPTISLEYYAPYTVQEIVNSAYRGGIFAAYGDSITHMDAYVTACATATGMFPVNKGVPSCTVAVNDTHTPGISILERIDADSRAYSAFTVMGGVNDWLYNTPLGTLDDSIATTNTFYGALKHICEGVLGRTNNPRLILFTMLQSNRVGANTAGITMAQYRQAIINVATYYGVPVVDSWAVGRIGPKTLGVYTSDGVHPNELWMSQVGPGFATRLRNL